MLTIRGEAVLRMMNLMLFGKTPGVGRTNVAMLTAIPTTFTSANLLVCSTNVCSPSRPGKADSVSVTAPFSTSVDSNLWCRPFDVDALDLELRGT